MFLVSLHKQAGPSARLVGMDPVALEEYHRGIQMAAARGHQQRQAAQHRAAQPHGDPEYADSLLKDWGFGLSSAIDANMHARLAQKAGAVGGYLKDLAAIGASGTNPKNCSTDIMDLARKLLGPALLPVYIALIPMFVAKSENGLPEPELCSAGLLLPHIWFWFLHKHYPKAFFKRLLGCTEAQATTRLTGYWDSVRADDPRRLPCMGRPHHRETAVPIGLHGDAVPCTKKDSLDVVSFFSLLGSGPTVAICFFCFRYLLEGNC